MPTIVLSVSRGQAEAYFLTADDGTEWIVKKFHNGMSLDSAYLGAIASLLPDSPAFRAGTSRRVLSSSDIACPGQPHVKEWFDGTVLMSRVRSRDWASVADSIREGHDVPIELRLGWVESLGMAMRALEDMSCAHRDLSSGNVFVDDQNGGVSLIDWDSMYHPSLAMPANTTGGTHGYVAPFVWAGDDVSGPTTWCERADRFALAVCCAEFVAMDAGAPLTGDGGMFDQVDLRGRAGPSIDHAVAKVRALSPELAGLFLRALGARSYDECPAPDQWVSAAQGTGLAPVRPAPALADIAWSEDEFLDHLTHAPHAMPIPAAPSLADLPDPAQQLSENLERQPQLPPPTPTSLPPDPWGRSGSH